MELVNAMKARLALLLSAASAVCSPFSIEVESSKSLLLPLPLSQIGSGHYNALCRYNDENQTRNVIVKLWESLRLRLKSLFSSFLIIED